MEEATPPPPPPQKKKIKKGKPRTTNEKTVMGIRERKQSHENEMSLKDLRERDRENKPIVLVGLYCSSSTIYSA